MIVLTATKLSPVLPRGRVTFEGDTNSLQKLMEKLKLARKWDKETRDLLDENEIFRAIQDLR